MAQAYICLGTCPSGGISPTSYKSLLVAGPAATPLAATFGAADADTSSLTRGGLTPEWAFECTAMTISSSTAKPARCTVPCVMLHCRNVCQFVPSLKRNLNQPTAAKRAQTANRYPAIRKPFGGTAAALGQHNRRCTAWPVAVRISGWVTARQSPICGLSALVSKEYLIIAPVIVLV